ncbi:unnamed protein product [Porites lobata]|uniref:Uncharacterized protein n=1 Tax=Porites lobata TaxID=104759 RepID=A0ABN8RN60_9CNID|nr:unnamed protein product [Porites lobata]
MNGAFYSNVDRLYVSREDGGRGLISCEKCVRGKENSLDWKGKRLHDQFLREIPGTTHVRETWSRLRKADWKIKTEGLICAGQEQALRTNHVTDTILTRPRESPLCR